jgi:hypothetical protein
MRTKTLPKIAASLFALFVFAVSQPASAAAPTATTQAASSITSTSAQLNSYVNPNGASTTIYFQYGLTTSYGSTTTSGSIGTSAGNYGTTVSGLTANTLYHFRIVAYNSGGTNYGGDLTFGLPPQPPSATTQAASLITSTSAQLNSYVNPNGASTTIYFQYGLTTNYGNFSATNTLASDLVDAQPVALPITGLLPGTTIHFQAVARNSAGTNLGGDSTFSTASGASSAPPVLVASLTNGATLVLTLYGNPGSNYTVVSATSLLSPITWTAFTNLTLTNAVQVINPGPLTNPMEFFRAAQQ